MSSGSFRSANLKVERAAEHIAELNKLLHKQPPFLYVIETDIHANLRTLRPKQNETVVERAALICGDVLHNLRSSLDQAYWEIVSPHVSEPERRKVQFPFCREANRLGEVIKGRLGDRAG